MAYRRLVDRDLVRQALDYDPETGIFRWRLRPLEHFADERVWRLWNAKLSGTIAGTASAGYQLIVINTRLYKAHRLAWLLVHGEPVPDEIDHINGDPGDNRIRNLRGASHADNTANGRLRRNNRTGKTGVHQTYNGKYVASIKRHYQTYHLGVFSSLDDAIAARREAEQRLHGAFARKGISS